jgi:hypothetical protein
MQANAFAFQMTSCCSAEGSFRRRSATSERDHASFKSFSRFISPSEHDRRPMALRLPRGQPAAHFSRLCSRQCLQQEPFASQPLALQLL